MNPELHLPARATHALILLFAIVVICSPNAATALELSPDAACRLLEDEGLQARGGYLKASGERYRCASFRKDLTAGGVVPHDLRFFAEGDATRVDRLGLELRVRSREDVQRALHRLADTANKLMSRATNRSLEPVVRNTILAGTDGRWLLDGWDVRLERDVFAGAGFELKFTIQ